VPANTFEDELALETLARVADETARGNVLPTRVGIGLHAGDAVTGRIGSSLRQEYTVIGLVRSAKDYRWSSITSFLSKGDQPLAVDHDCWWTDDAEKLSQAIREMGWHR
jgi:hypothetical protein